MKYEKTNPTQFKAYAIWNHEIQGIQDGAPLFECYTDANQWIRKQDNYIHLSFTELKCQIA